MLWNFGNLEGFQTFHKLEHPGLLSKIPHGLFFTSLLLFPRILSLFLRQSKEGCYHGYMALRMNRRMAVISWSNKENISKRDRTERFHMNWQRSRASSADGSDC